jgi:acetoin utilization protein AcuB
MLAGAMKKAPHDATAIRTFMTPAPRTIRPDQTLEEAHAVMRSLRVRHLPVVRAGKLVGVVSQRDLALIESLRDVDPAEVPVEDAMSSEIFAVGPDTPLAVVAAEMARRKLGSAIVTEASRPVGVFTVTDACRALSSLAPSRARGRAAASPPAAPRRPARTRPAAAPAKRRPTRAR